MYMLINLFVFLLLICLLSGPQAVNLEWVEAKIVFSFSTLQIDLYWVCDSRSICSIVRVPGTNRDNVSRDICCLDRTKHYKKKWEERKELKLVLNILFELLLPIEEEIKYLV